MTRTPNIGVTCNVEADPLRRSGRRTPRWCRSPTCARSRAPARGRSCSPPRRPTSRTRPSCSACSTACSITGGADVDPAAYGAAPHPETAPTRGRPRRLRAPAGPRRGRARPALPRHLPRHAGGQRGLRRRARAAPPRPPRARHPPRRRTATSPTTASTSSPAASPRWPRAATDVAVKSYHHQGVARVGDGLRVTAHAQGDGTVEAVEDRDRRFMLGVLWHPEEDEADRADRRLRPRVPRELAAARA